MGELAEKARDGKLGAGRHEGGCFSICSLGGIGGTQFTPIINAPEVAILGVCRSTMEPVWDGKAFVPRLMLPLSLSYDHRVIDGAAAARFTAYLAQVLGRLPRGSCCEERDGTIEVKVPDIGDFKDVAVIEVLVKPGDTVKAERSLVTLESDKATMEVPSPHAGVVKELKRQGRRQGQRGLVLILSAGGGCRSRCAGAAAPLTAARCRSGCGASAPQPAPRPGGARSRRCASARAPPAYAGSGRHRVRDAGARRRPRRLLRRVPRRRPRHEDGAGRALRDARRRLPERRLHPVEGAAARRRGHGRGEALRPTSASTSARRRSTSTSCARTRTRSSAS